MSESQTRILVVDDDPDLRDLLTSYLAREGFAVAGAEDGRAMDAVLAETGADLILLDLMLPGEDGLSIARRLRQTTHMPIIMLSARGDEVDRIVGLEVGADDYVAKPFNPRELLARIRAVLRRQAQAQAGAQPDDPGRCATRGGRRRRPGGLQLRPLSPGPALPSPAEGRRPPIPLTSGELDLLAALAAHPNRVLDRDRLLDLLKGYERSPFDRSIDVQIARLRAKIEPDTKRPRLHSHRLGQGLHVHAPGRGLGAPWRRAQPHEIHLAPVAPVPLRPGRDHPDLHLRALCPGDLLRHRPLRTGPGGGALGGGPGGPDGAERAHPGGPAAGDAQ